MASAFGKVVAHVSSASDVSESVTEKIGEYNERVNYKVFLQTVTGIEHPKPLIFLHNYFKLCMYFFFH